MNEGLLVLWLVIGFVTMIDGFVTVECYFFCWASLLCSILYNIFDREEREYEQK